MFRQKQNTKRKENKDAEDKLKERKCKKG